MRYIISQSFSARAILTLLSLDLHCRKGCFPPEWQRSGFGPSADLRSNIVASAAWRPRPGGDTLPPAGPGCWAASAGAWRGPARRGGRAVPRAGGCLSPTGGGGRGPPWHSRSCRPSLCFVCLGKGRSRVRKAGKYDFNSSSYSARSLSKVCHNMKGGLLPKT